MNILYIYVNLRKKCPKKKLKKLFLNYKLKKILIENKFQKYYHNNMKHLL